MPLSGHHDVALFEWRRHWHWIDTKLHNYVIIASLNSKTTCKLINRIPGSRLLISSLPGKKPSDSTCALEALPGKLDIKRHSPSILVSGMYCIWLNKCTCSYKCTLSILLVVKLQFSFMSVHWSYFTINLISWFHQKPVWSYTAVSVLICSNTVNTERAPCICLG